MRFAEIHDARLAGKRDTCIIGKMIIDLFMIFHYQLLHVTNFVRLFRFYCIIIKIMLIGTSMTQSVFYVKAEGRMP